MPPTTASYRRVGRGFDSPARAHTNTRNNRPRCAWFSSPSFVAAVPADNNQCLCWVATGLQTLPMVVWIPTVLGYTVFVGQNLTIRSSM